METPLARYFRTCFGSAKRSPTLLENELQKILHIFNERMIIPVAALLVVIAIVVRLFKFLETAGSVLDMILIEFPSCMIPLLGISFPFFMTVVNLWNLSSLIAGFEKQSEPPQQSTESSETTELFVEESPEVSQLNVPAFLRTCAQFEKLVRGHSLCLPFSANLVHVMGNVTSISVVDKKGLLSWPNPTPEKIFFFKDAERSSLSFGSGVQQGSSLPEVLSLTHDPDQAFSSNFDDPHWIRYLPNLKPIGLNILLNSCNLDEDYVHFLDHVHVVSEWVPRTIAVVNRRCCCNLAKLFGFIPEVTRGQFRPVGTIAAYKKVAGEAPVKGLTKHRTPLPNVFASLSGDSVSLNQHVMSQGTADLILDMSSHCWTGMGLAELTKSSKKKILDFYHRNSMTSYCVCFSYRPLIALQRREDPLSDAYISWPLKECAEEEKRGTSGLKTAESPMKTAVSAALSAESLVGDISEVQAAALDKDSALTDHIFLGVVTLQYQAKPDVVRLVEHLDKACVRLVHFSKENELRSRIFAEKMGLEAGWNCHVSLASEGSTDFLRTQSVPASSLLTGTSQQNSLLPFRVPSLPRTNSLPQDLNFYSQPSWFNDASRSVLISMPEDISLEDNKEAEESPLLSEQTSRTSAGDNSDAPASSGFVFPNRAQLPKGVNNVRPHLETKDNVPLLVNLFTDSDHVSTREMLEIMEEYGEIVVVVGSSLNYHNADIFCQASASIAVEPMHPTPCAQATESETKSVGSGEASTRWANLLASLPCCLCVDSGKRINFLELLAFARHRLALLRASLIFLFSACMYLFLVRTLGLLLFLPPIFDLPQVLLWVIAILPTLGFSLCVGPDTMREGLKMSTAKNQKWVPRKIMIDYSLGFSAKFIPSMAVVIVLYGSLLPLLCEKIPNSDCWWYFVNESTPGSWGGWELEYSGGLVLAQQMSSFFVTLYFCVISLGFVHFRENLWNCSPFRNRVWILGCFVSLVLQVVYSFCVYETQIARDVIFSFADMPWPLCLAGTFWIIPLIAINELYKRREIKLYRRDQRRRRLSFGTKLGLNSPW